MGPIRFCALGAAATLASATLVGAASVSPAKAADLAGGCCQDLEQRVAELEATAVRKGNRKVSLELYGQVNRALLLWNDGVRSNAYVVDNTLSATRLGVKGEGKVATGLKSGFNIEFDFTDSSSSNVSQYPTGTPAKGGDNGNGEAGPVSLRLGYWYLDTEKAGRVSLGHLSPATDDLTIVNVAGTSIASDGRLLWTGNFIIHGTTGLRWAHIADGLDTDRGDFIRYDTPSILGFILSTAWGENDQWDIAVRYKGEWGPIRVAGGVGYYYTGDGVISTDSGLVPNNNINYNIWGSPAGFSNGANARREEVKGSVSVKHVPTGLYANVSAGGRNPLGYAPEAGFWYLQAGIDKRFFPAGDTTVYGEYGNYSKFGVNAYKIDGSGNIASNMTVSTPTLNGISNSEVNRWGAGVVQKFDAAALEVYGVYQHWEADVRFYNNGENLTSTAKAATDGFDSFAMGGRVKF